MRSLNTRRVVHVVAFVLYGLEHVLLGKLASAAIEQALKQHVAHTTCHAVHKPLALSPVC